MANPTNLNQVRKAKDRAKKHAEGTENAAAFGQSKARKELLKARAEKARAALDAHKRTPE